jgi:hypothetical protein
MGLSCSLAGVLSGNVAVVQSVIGEITDETNQGAAFPLAVEAGEAICVSGIVDVTNSVSTLECGSD